MIFSDIATHWHRVYALHVEALLKYSGPSGNAIHVLPDAHACYLGKWLSGTGKAYAAFPDFLELKACHDAFHELTDQALREAAQNRNNAIWLTRMSDHLHRASLQVTEALARLDSVINPGRRAADVSSHATDCPTGQYRTGIRIIDEQHEALTALTKRLWENASEKITYQENMVILRELAALTALHFDTEEVYMECIQLPPLELEKHKAQHKQILSRLFALCDNAEELSHYTIADLMPKFALWFKDHLIDYDYSLKQY
jgi:hemerythrin-like metal-binding protein